MIQLSPQETSGLQTVNYNSDVRIRNEAGVDPMELYQKRFSEDKYIN
jgi:hypothetical protein